MTNKQIKTGKDCSISIGGVTIKNQVDSMTKGLDLDSSGNIITTVTNTGSWSIGPSPLKIGNNSWNNVTLPLGVPNYSPAELREQALKKVKDLSDFELKAFHLYVVGAKIANSFLVDGRICVEDLEQEEADRAIQKMIEE
jgi:hypothetical protein